MTVHRRTQTTDTEKIRKQKTSKSVFFFKILSVKISKAVE